MSAPRLFELRRGLRIRRALAFIVAWTPWLIVAGAFAERLFGLRAAVIASGIAAVAIGLVAFRIARRVDFASVVRRLDSAAPSLEDSSDLLLRDTASLSTLQALQRARVAQRLATADLPDLRSPWPLRRIVASALLALLAVIAIGLWPTRSGAPLPVQAAAGESVLAPTATTLVSAQIDIEPPAYTALAARSEPQLDLAAAAGSRLRWRLRFDTAPREVALAFHDGSRLALVRDGDDWAAHRELTGSTLYRIALVDGPPLTDDRLHRLDAVVDAPPVIRVLEPERTLTMLESAQTSWPLAFEASDDYGVASARMLVTLAQGSGEQVTVKQHEIALRAEAGGDARNRRYRHQLDLGAVGFAQGDDVIVRFTVSDARVPQANVARSASFILRWPPDLSAEAEGVDGIVQKVLPAYFRSQRQIIIDTESLLAERAQLDKDTFVARSDAIGVDQKILRLRYGQFLGEEFESGGAPKGAAPKAEDGHDHEDGGGADADADALPEGHTHDDGHDHGTPAFGDAGALVAEYGHTHDHAEAATLLDPETKRILKAALGEMWQAELHLRMGEPKAALPFENRALGFIKQVQQASRIYLARVGLELPPVDESRRLSGERKDLRDVRSAIDAAGRDDAPLVEFHAALERGDAADASAFVNWLRAREEGIPDALAVHAALDAWQRDAACAACREELLDRLWPLMPSVPPATHARRAPDAAGAAYLDALRDGAKP